MIPWRAARRKRDVLTLVLASACLAFAGPGRSAPTKGSFAIPQRVTVEAGGDFQFTESFRANERACVLVEGDRDPPVDLEIQVFDKSGNLVAEDRDGGDLAAAIWYPAREGEYRVSIKHNGPVLNRVRIVLK